MRALAKAALCAAALSTLPAHASITLGVLGDSLSDEYLGAGAIITDGRTDLSALSWTQILAQTRPEALNFGAFEADPAVRGEPRYEGYEHVWARAGGTALTPGLMRTVFPNSTTIEDFWTLGQQAEGLMPAVQAGEIDAVFIGIGANDFLVRNGINNPDRAKPLSGPDYVAWENDLIDAIFSEVDALTAVNNPAILVALIPGVAMTDVGANSELAQAIASANGRIADEADARGLEVVNFYGWRGDAARVDEAGRIIVGDLVVEAGTAPYSTLVLEGTPGAGPCMSFGVCAGPEHARYFTAEDGIHPNTVIQGLMANEIIAALNRALDLDIAPLRDYEILQLAGYPTEIPLPASAWLLGSALAGLGMLRRRGRGFSRIPGRPGGLPGH